MRARRQQVTKQGDVGGAFDADKVDAILVGR
jgi:hypothetical protein